MGNGHLFKFSRFNSENPPTPSSIPLHSTTRDKTPPTAFSWSPPIPLSLSLCPYHGWQERRKGNPSVHCPQEQRHPQEHLPPRHPASLPSTRTNRRWWWPTITNSRNRERNIVVSWATPRLQHHLGAPQHQPIPPPHPLQPLFPPSLPHRFIIW